MPSAPRSSDKEALSVSGICECGARPFISDLLNEIEYFVFRQAIGFTSLDVHVRLSIAQIGKRLAGFQRMIGGRRLSGEFGQQLFGLT